MQIIHTADWQFGRTSIPESMQRQETALLEMCEVAISKKISEIVIAGDIFQQHVPTQEEKDSFLSILFEFERSGINLRFIIGNHDRETIGDYHSLRTFSILNKGRFFSNVHVYDKPGVYNIDDKYVLVVLDDESPLFFDDSSFESIPVILAYHGILKGSIADNGFEFTEGVSIGNLINRSPIPVNYVALGDIHKRQQMHGSPPSYYCGALVQQTFGEYSAGFLIVDFSEKKVKVEEYDIQTVPQVLTIEHDIADIKVLGKETAFQEFEAGYITKIVLHGTPEEKKALNLSSLKKKLLKEWKSVHEIVWSFKLKIATSKVRRLQKISSSSEAEDDFEVYLDSIDGLELDPEKLKSLAATVIKEARENVQS